MAVIAQDTPDIRIHHHKASSKNYKAAFSPINLLTNFLTLVNALPEQTLTTAHLTQVSRPAQPQRSPNQASTPPSPGRTVKGHGRRRAPRFPEHCPFPRINYKKKQVCPLPLFLFSFSQEA